MACRVFVALVVGLAFFAPGACDCGAEPVEPPGAPCSFNSDCALREHCEAGFCAAGLEPGTCLEDGDCDGEALCVLPDGSDVGACIDPNECTDDADCDEGKICRDANDDGIRECVFDGCESDDECAAELDCIADVEEAKCVARACRCQDLCGAPCGEDRQCCAVPGTQRACIDDPGPCARLDCPPGFDGATDQPGPWSAVGCDYDAAVCACRELPPLLIGDVGTPHVLVAHATAGRFVVAYHATYGDVVVGPATGAAVPSWVFAAGVPTGAPIVAGPSGPRGGVAEPGDDVGRMLDAAFAPDGVLHIVARDETNQALLHVSGPPAGPFTTEILDDVDDPGFYPSLTIDGTGRLLVAEAARRTTGGDSVVRLLAQPTAGAAPTLYSRKVIATLDLATVACEGGCASGKVCPAPAVEDDLPVCVTAGTSCTCDADEVCTTTGCKPAATPAVLDDALALDHLSLAGAAVFGHRGHGVDALVGVRIVGDAYAGTATFSTTTILDDPTALLGARPSAASFTGGYRIASVDESTRAVVMTTVTTTLSGADTLVVDDGQRPHASGAIDDHTVDLPTISLRADGAGILLWQDGTDGSLRAREIVYEVSDGGVASSDASLGPSQILAGGRLAPVYAGTFALGSSSLAALPVLLSSKRVQLATDPPTFEVALLDGPMSCPADDPGESHDAQAEAAPVTTGAVVSGIICSDEDWFVLQVGAGCTVTAELIFRGDDGDLDLFLVDAAGTQLDASRGTDDDEVAETTPAAAGPVSLRVIGYQSDSNAYVLRVDVSCP